jgi:REP element-mobilizing transposase RayT
MPRIARLLIDSESTLYHVMSRTALDGFPMGDKEKEYLLNHIKRYSKLYLVDIIGFSFLDNHFHILLKMHPGDHYSDKEIKDRYTQFYDDDLNFKNDDIQYYRDRWSSLSCFMSELKLRFTRFYNRCHNRRGFFWGGRFKSVIVDKGETLINCLAYIDLNPVRAHIVEKPELYRWCSLGYLIQTGNKDKLLN